MVSILCLEKMPKTYKVLPGHNVDTVSLLVNGIYILRRYTSWPLFSKYY